MSRDWHRPGEMPWGWWLRVTTNMLVDEDGRRWNSVRDAFFQGELGFQDVHYAEEQHELMLRVLSSVDQQWVGSAEKRHDLFDGEIAHWRFYMNWLASIGMLNKTDRLERPTGPLEAGLSPEGRSVLMMLRATREPEWEALPFSQVLDIVAAAERRDDDATRESKLQAFERAVGMRRHVFARARVGRSHVVTLTSLASGRAARMPTLRVTWSASFTDELIRDDLFAWLAARVDRWEDWGALAYSRGGEAFSQHLLTIYLASGRDS